HDRTGASTDAVLPKLSLAAVTTALGGVVTPANHLCCDGGKAIVGFARRAQIPATSCHSPAVRDRKLPISTSTASTAITAASRNGCVPSTAWPPDTLTITSAGAGLSKPSGPSPGRR